MIVNYLILDVTFNSGNVGQFFDPRGPQLFRILSTAVGISKRKIIATEVSVTLQIRIHYFTRKTT